MFASCGFHWPGILEQDCPRSLMNAPSAMHLTESLAALVQLVRTSVFYYNQEKEISWGLTFDFASDIRAGEKREFEACHSARVAPMVRFLSNDITEVSSMAREI
jgi:hypothetical protein